MDIGTTCNFVFVDEAKRLWACLVTIFENCFLFSKTRRKRKIGRTCLVSIFFVMKNMENTEFKKTVFRENGVLCVFKKCSQEQFSKT